MHVFSSTLWDLWRRYALILGVTVLGLLALIANPGYFSHDELQKLDHIRKTGVEAYMADYVRLRAGDSFGTPVRPLSFAVQGVLALFMERYPVIVHLFAVLSHSAVACLLYAMVRRLGGESRYALLAALCFALSPTGILATGWSAALMDRLYLLFGLAALLCSDTYIRGKGGVFSLAGILVFSGLAMLSKETAVVLPLSLVAIGVVEPRVFRERRFWIALCVWSLPVIAFLAIRLSALVASFGSPAVSAYKASFDNLPQGVLVYYAYPFLTSLTEAGNWVFISPPVLWGTLALHALLVVGVAAVVGARYAFGYVLFYTLFLIPVLLIPIKAAHYLYGSGLVLGCAVAAMLVYSGRYSLWAKGFVLALCGLMLAHTIVLEGFVYSVGACTNKVLVGTEALHASRGGPKAIDFQAEPGAAEHMLHRMFTGRDRVGDVFNVKLSVSPYGSVPPEGTQRLVMKSDCQMVER